MTMMISKEQISHLSKLINYLADDEWKHYDERGRPDGHIFQSVVALVEFSTSPEFRCAQSVHLLVLDTLDQVSPEAGKTLLRQLRSLIDNFDYEKFP